MKIVTTILWISGILAPITLMAPYIAIFLTFVMFIPIINVIGIPIAFIFLAMPAIFIVTLISSMLHRVLPFKSKKSGFFSVLLCLGLLSLPPMYFNFFLVQKVNSYVADDHNDLSLPVDVSSIAVRKRSELHKTETQCDGFCLHALLSGSVKNVLVIDINETNDFNVPLSSTEKATKFSLQALGHCPPVVYHSGVKDLRLIDPQTGQIDQTDPILQLRLRMSSGECLIAKPAELREADLVVSIGSLHHPRPKAWELSISHPSTVDRISVHTTVGQDDTFKETYRRTSVKYAPFAPILLPALASSHGFEIEMGWPHLSKQINYPENSDSKPPLEKFLTDTLSLNLYLNNAHTESLVLSQIELALTKANSPSVNEWGMFFEYLDQFAYEHNYEPDTRFLELISNVLENPNFPAPKHLDKILQNSEEFRSSEHAHRVAEALFKRLETGQTWSDSLTVSYEQNIAPLAAGVSALPPHVIQDKFGRFVKLLFDPTIQNQTELLIKKLQSFGNKAVPIYIEMIDMGLGKRNTKSNRQDIMNMAGFNKYTLLTEGLIGLCLVGGNENSALEDLVTLLGDGTIHSDSSYNTLLYNTLASLNADPELIWPIFSNAHESLTRQDLDFFLDSNQWRCR